MKFPKWEGTRNLLALLEIPAPDTEFFTRRIETVEKGIVLPIKVVVVVLLVYYFYFSGLMRDVEGDPTRGGAVEASELFFRAYLLINIIGAVVVVSLRRMPLAVTQWTVFCLSMVDALFLSALTLITGGFDSLLYWIYPGLILRNVISVPATASQVVLNLCVSLCYFAAGVLDLWIGRYEERVYDPTTLSSTGLGLPENPAETLLLRLIILWLLTACCYGVQVLLEKERLAAEEAREFAVRQEQLHSAGRLAAEIAHQLKNPLAIMNNAAFSLRRSLHEGRGNPLEQAGIIQEEVERSDRIIRRLISDGRLSEAQVEKLNVVEEVDKAIAEVFPEAANFEVSVHRDYFSNQSAVFMQRSHLSEILLNLLQNAREALDGRGNVWVRTRAIEHRSVEISVRDDGPGVPPEKRAQVFEPYYTGKPKGSGLGLSIAKHHAELYGGSLRVESELGKGAGFILMLPTRMLTRS